MPAAALPEHNFGLDLTGRWTPRLPGELIAHWGETIPGRPAVTFIDYLSDRSGIRREYTWAQWEPWTRAVAHELMKLAGRTDRVAIMAPQGPEYIVGFHAALRAGVVSVPLFQPDLPGHGDRLEHVFDDCNPTVVITTSDKRELVEKLIATRGLTGQVELLLPEELFETEKGAEAAAAFVPPADLTLDDLAYLQYTSGSTRNPAGVELTHVNLVYNIAQIVQAHDVTTPNGTSVGWLPLFHDMGLLLGAAATAIVGSHSVLMDPIAFLLKPSRWTTELPRHESVMTAAPNFAYAVGAKKTKEEQLEGLDFSNVAALVNGAEPVLVSTIEMFDRKFAPHGLPDTAHRPSYGLAEATLFVAVGDPKNPRVIVNADPDELQQARLVEGDPARRTAPIVSCGRPFGLQVAIVVDGQVQPEGGVGEIWVNGPNVGRGYWGRPEETEETFGGKLSPEVASASDLPEGPWLRTGDLGALIGSDLFITGRQKDLIIIDGRNVYPHDVEYSVENAHDDISLHKLAAFSVDLPDGEGVVVVAEQFRGATDAGSRLEQITNAARQKVSEEHSVTLHDFVLIAPDTIPWTSSGKIARRATRDAYLSGSLNQVRPAE